MQAADEVRRMTSGDPGSDGLRAGVCARFAWDGARSRVQDLSQAGGYRLALPSTFKPYVEASQINTGGGVVGGDAITTRLDVEEGGDVVFSTQGAERVYRSAGPVASMSVALRLAGGARLDWLPQQTILYAGARLRRRIEVAMTGDSRLLMVELVTFGRPASQEGTEAVDVDDHWRIRRDGRLIYAEGLRLAGAMTTRLARGAIGGQAVTSGIVLYITADAGERLAGVRDLLEETGCEAGASAWNGMLAVRLLAHRPADAVRTAAAVARHLAQRDMPRVWSV